MQTIDELREGTELVTNMSDACRMIGELSELEGASVVLELMLGSKLLNVEMLPRYYRV